MTDIRLICIFLSLFIEFIYCSEDFTEFDAEGSSNNENDDFEPLKKNGDDSNCWMKLGAPGLFKTMEKLDKKYATTRKTVQRHFEDDTFDDQMLEEMLRYRGAAARELTNEMIHFAVIPAGINLGGLLIMRMPNSLVFFHRMKLRNSTVFRINALHNDLESMTLRAHISLNDLHLKGAYDRTLTDGSRSKLAYQPTFGELQIFLKDARYKMEGRYRLIKKRLVIELVISEITVEDVIIEYANQKVDNPVIRIEKRNVREFLERLKTDLDKWVKDYFNDRLIYTGLEKVPMISSLENYDKEKAAALAEYMDYAIDTINKRIRKHKGQHIRTPEFTITTLEGVTFTITHGCLRGLDTLYRRSVATSVLTPKNVRKVDAIVGFSDLKVIYRYQLSTPIVGGLGSATQAGVVTLSANELTAHLGLGLLKDPEVVEIDIDFLNPLGPDSLTVEGPGNILISNFKHLLKHEITAIMANSLIFGVNLLKSLPKCTPFPPAVVIERSYLSGNKYAETSDIDSSEIVNLDPPSRNRESDDDDIDSDSDALRKGTNQTGQESFKNQSPNKIKH
ncbi:uncharacterized protein LOC142977961 [Anticarsia gemmatalis]|uniref:uncharacterized protein LOC142977961 n=1 Tax=Anticarsia gemmatalis TaxID=129554 RepID=UPI003F759977